MYWIQYLEFKDGEVKFIRRYFEEGSEPEALAQARKDRKKALEDLKTSNDFALPVKIKMMKNAALW